MKTKLLVLLILAALAGGTGLWAAGAASESAVVAPVSLSTTAEPAGASEQSSCCGYCVPGEFCDLKRKGLPSGDSGNK